MRIEMRTMILLLALVACGKGKGATGGSGARDAVIDAWKAAKLTPSALTPATVTFGKDCQSGTVSGIDVLLCNFASAAEAKAAEEPALTWIGQATGSAQAHGDVLIVLADRHKTDPSGRTINQLMKLAPK